MDGQSGLWIDQDAAAAGEDAEDVLDPFDAGADGAEVALESESAAADDFVDDPLDDDAPGFAAARLSVR